VYKVSELAKLIKVNRSTIYDWINKGKLKATVNTTKIRKKFIIEELDVEKLKKNRISQLKEQNKQILNKIEKLKIQNNE
jgi:excisionase family DNA binding protein